ncbi:MAG: hypothetical protein DI563_04160 [Variovorax paradoxus]|uniref:Transposase IS4-like domain-containing protein n=1 Tax=Variovorax paradoxus TaxID=34073 RepID=A0A2W5QJW1_VARPD|nr:MAG: hypothetical protein DI563_04160 [Variovorax paradoxus]
MAHCRHWANTRRRCFRRSVAKQCCSDRWNCRRLESQRGSCKYFLSTLPEDITINELVSVAQQRWRIERDYQVGGEKDFIERRLAGRCPFQ